MNASKLSSIYSSSNTLVNGSTPQHTDTSSGVDGTDLCTPKANGAPVPTDSGDLVPEEKDLNSGLSDLWLDEKRTRDLGRVESKDTESAQKDIAREITAHDFGVICELGGAQGTLGSKEHIEAIRKTGWCPWEGVFRIGSHATVLVDAAAWLLCGVRVLVNTSGMLLAASALAIALGGRFLGRYFSTTHLIDPTSAKHTVEGHIAAIRRVSYSACILIILIVIPLLLPGKWALFFVTIATVFLVALNVHLALLSGIAASLADTLSRPHRYDEIEYEIDQRLRLRRALKKYLPKAMMVLALVISASKAADALGTCGLFVDEKITLDAEDREKAVSFAVDTILDQTASFDCSWVVAGVFGNDGRFTKRTWLPVPPKPEARDCNKAEPEPLTGHEVLFDNFKSVYDERKESAVEACKSSEKAKEGTRRTARAVFIQKLRTALSVSPQVKLTPVRDFILYTVRSSLYKHLTILTDTLDNPAASLDGLALPPAVEVSMVVVRPNPNYSSMRQALVRAREWAKVPGVRVVTTGELRPGLWADLSKAR